MSFSSSHKYFSVLKFKSNLSIVLWRYNFAYEESHGLLLFKQYQIIFKWMSFLFWVYNEPKFCFGVMPIAWSRPWPQQGLMEALLVLKWTSWILLWKVNVLLCQLYLLVRTSILTVAAIVSNILIIVTCPTYSRISKTRILDHNWHNNCPKLVEFNFLFTTKAVCLVSVKERHSAFPCIPYKRKSDVLSSLKNTINIWAQTKKKHTSQVCIKAR